VKITYVIGAKNNPLYDNNFKVNGQYQTFGHHSFCYDLITDFVKKGCVIEVLTDDLDVFPLVAVLMENQITIKNINTVDEIISDVAIIDSVTDTLLDRVRIQGLKIGIIHDYLKFESAKFYSFCDKIICLTDAAKTRQSLAVDPQKITVITQGIDLSRFKPSEPAPSEKTALIYSRMDRHKGSIYIPIIDRLIANGFSVNVLGAGIYFDQIGGNFAGGITCHQHIPCYKIHNFIRRFSLIVSNGRGVMEGLASGRPTIAAGVRYCGLLDKSNIEFFFERNFTGSNSVHTVEKIDEDLTRLSDYKTDDFRQIAEKYFNVSDFTDRLLALKNA
jgi:glycosyltransferase involved in cell wall biosynthesis